MWSIQMRHLIILAKHRAEQHGRDYFVLPDEPVCKVRCVLPMRAVKGIRVTPKGETRDLIHSP